MGNMRLFKVIIVLISLLGCNAYAHELEETKGSLGEMPTPIFLGEDSKYSMTSWLFRATQYMKFRLKKDEKKMHESAVYFMLDNAETGKIVSWYSKKRLANGKVRVVHSYPISGGYCRTYQAYIKVNGKERHMTNNACKRITSGMWTFYK